MWLHFVEEYLLYFPGICHFDLYKGMYLEITECYFVVAFRMFAFIF